MAKLQPKVAVVRAYPPLQPSHSQKLRNKKNQIKEREKWEKRQILTSSSTLRQIHLLPAFTQMIGQNLCQPLPHPMAEI